MRSRHVSRVIRADARTVYEFASDPANLPAWATGLAGSEVVRRGDVLVVDSPMGEVTVRFTPVNEYGILDHDVTLPSGTIVTNPMRVSVHPQGSEVVFTVRQIELSDEEFDRDVALVQRDLETLGRLLESDD